MQPSQPPSNTPEHRALNILDLPRDEAAKVLAILFEEHSQTRTALENIKEQLNNHTQSAMWGREALDSAKEALDRAKEMVEEAEARQEEIIESVDKMMDYALYK